MKLSRHAEILKIIQESDIETQAELAACLNKAGYAVTQATVSRDIRELRLSKAPLANGHVHYVAPEEDDISLKTGYVFKASILSVKTSGNLLVIKTVPGMAMGTAFALDKWNNKKIIGTIAGDDTIFCSVSDDSNAADVKKELEAFISSM